MKVATKADKPDWFDRPANVVGVNVCRVSGKLPNGGCDHVEVVNRDGLIETRSMIYTDYFLKGKQPTELCPLHPSPTFMDRVAGMFGAGEAGKPVRADEVAIPPAETGTAGAHPASPPPAVHADDRPDDPKADTAQKKRGFWGRLFGKDGKKDDQDDQKDQNQKKKKGQ